MNRSDIKTDVNLEEPVEVKEEAVAFDGILLCTFLSAPIYVDVYLLVIGSSFLFKYLFMILNSRVSKHQIKAK